MQTAVRRLAAGKPPLRSLSTGNAHTQEPPARVPIVRDAADLKKLLDGNATVGFEHPRETFQRRMRDYRAAFNSEAAAQRTKLDAAASSKREAAAEAHRALQAEIAAYKGSQDSLAAAAPAAAAKQTRIPAVIQRKREWRSMQLALRRRRYARFLAEQAAEGAARVNDLAFLAHAANSFVTPETLDERIRDALRNPRWRQAADTLPADARGLKADSWSAAMLEASPAHAALSRERAAMISDALHGTSASGKPSANTTATGQELQARRDALSRALASDLLSTL